MIGPGKYDRHLMEVLLRTGGHAGCLVIFGGREGFGTSCRVDLPDGVPEALAFELGHRAIVKALHDLADSIEAEIPNMLAQLGKKAN